MARPCILSVAGSDSGAGAGIQADSRVIHTLGGFALNAVTAVTAQNTRGVRSWEPVNTELLIAQIRSVAQDFSIAAVKTGLVSGEAQVGAIARSLPRGAKLVVDPVIGSTSGTRFLNKRGVSQLQRLLFPQATLVTPNWPEAAALSGLPVTTQAQARAAAEVLVMAGCQAVLVKGGHAEGTLCRDILVTRQGTRAEFATLRIDTMNTHGTGCVLSAAIATGLGQGMGLVPAIEQARRFLSLALELGSEARWGTGHGPAFSGW